MRCELCGSEGQLFISVVEGVKLKVCKICSKFGSTSEQIFEKNEIRAKKVLSAYKVEQGVIFSNDFGQIIKNAREILGLKQAEVAEKIQIKESLYRSIESGRVEPPIELAKKIEDFLKIKIQEEVKLDYETKKDKSRGGLTIGDLIHTNDSKPR